MFSLVDTYYPTVLLADTVCTHSHALLLLVQLTKLVTTAHEQCAMTRDACWKNNFCQFERGVGQLGLAGLVPAPDGCCNMMMQWWEGSGAPPSSVYSHLMCYVWCILVFCIQTVLSSSIDSAVSCADRQQNKAIHLRRLAAGLMSNLCLKSAKHSLPPHHLPAAAGWSDVNIHHSAQWEFEEERLYFQNRYVLI